MGASSNVIAFLSSAKGSFHVCLSPSAGPGRQADGERPQGDLSWARRRGNARPARVAGGVTTRAGFALGCQHGLVVLHDDGGRRRLFGRNGMVMALVGQASTQARHLVHSEKLMPASGCHVDALGHTAAHASQEVPWALSRHFALSMAGTKVRFALPTRLMSALMGQNLLHHLRKNTTSASKSAGTRMTPQGHVAEGEQAHDQHNGGEGEPDGADEAEHGEAEDGRREQRAAQDDVAGIERRPLLGAGRAARLQPERAACSSAERGAGASAERGAGRVGGLRSLRGFLPADSRPAGKTPVPASVFDVFFEKMPRIFDTTARDRSIRRRRGRTAG